MSFIVMIKLKNIRFMYASGNGMLSLLICWMHLASQGAPKGETP
jgi:hypothetical protein